MPSVSASSESSEESIVVETGDFLSSWEAASAYQKLNTGVLALCVREACAYLLPDSGHKSEWKLKDKLTPAEATAAFRALEPLVTATDPPTKPTFAQALAVTHKKSKTPVLFEAVVSASEVVGGSSQQYTNTFRAFGVPFVSADYVELFHQRLGVHMAEWKASGSLFSPFQAVINSSMTGKSRLVLSLTDRGVFVFVICLRRDDNPKMCPPKTPLIADWARTPATPGDLYPFTNEACILIFRCLKKLDKWLAKRVQKTETTEKLAAVTVVELARDWAAYVQAKGLVFWERIEAKMTKYRASYPAAVAEAVASAKSLDDPGVAGKIAEAWQPFNTDVKDQISAKVVQLVGSADAAKAGQILFFIDEARQFARTFVEGKSDHSKDKFVRFRRCLRSLPFNFADGIAVPAPHVFCVVTDTASKLSNLAPAITDDASLRVLQGGADLCEPFFLLKTQSLWWKQALKLGECGKRPAGLDASSLAEDDQQKLVDTLFKFVASQLLNRDFGDSGVRLVRGEKGGKKFDIRDFLTMAVMQSFWFMSLQGRPFHFASFGLEASSGWGASADAASVALVELMQGKLLNDGTFKQKLKEGKFVCSDVQALAVFTTLVAVDISPRSQKASELSANHMRMLAGVSCDRSQAFTIEAVDAILGAAARLLLDRGAVTWAKGLDVITRELRMASSVSTGFRGEIGGQVLALMAWHKVLADAHGDSSASSQCNDFPARPVTEFLEKLLGRRVAALRQSSQKADELEAKPVDFAVDLLRSGDGSAEQQVWDLFDVLKENDAGALLGIASTVGRLTQAGPDVVTSLLLQGESVTEVLQAKSAEGVTEADVQKVLDFVGLYPEEQRASALSAVVLLSKRPSLSKKELQEIAKLVAASGKDALIKATKTKLTLLSWEDMQEQLKEALVRLNQFAKTYSGLSEELLLEAWLRAAAVYCKENQVVVDLCVPMKMGKGVLAAESLGAFVWQLKLKQSWEKVVDKTAWLEHVKVLPVCQDASELRPFVALFCEFGPVKNLGEPAQYAANIEVLPVFKTSLSPASKKRKGATQRKPCGFAIFVRGLSVIDVSPGETEAQAAFHRLLASSVDPAESPDVQEWQHNHIADMFNDLAYLGRKTKK